MLVIKYLLILTLALPALIRTTNTELLVQQLTPESAFLALGNDVGALLRRAMAEPSDTKTLAVLQSDGAKQIRKRQQQLQPAFTKWLASRTPAQRQAFGENTLLHTDMMKYMQTLEHDPKANARLERNPKIRSALQQLVAGMLVNAN